MEMISLVHDKFNDITANEIIRFTQHPTAKMMKGHIEYKEVLKSDPRHNWNEWQTLYGLAHIGNRNRHYITYGGGPEGGIKKSYGDGWYIWHRNWGGRVLFTRTPDELEVIYRHDDGHEAIELVLMGNDGYEVGDDRWYLDDL